MKAPSFWFTPFESSSLLSAVLTPLSALYSTAAHFHRTSTPPQTVGIPVICLGNLVAGGSGKTPTAIALLQLLKDHKVFLSPGFLTRGYRGKVRSAERVDESHNPVLWGDEALLLHRHGPTFVSPNRLQGAQLMQQHGCDAVIMDDGLQHYGLKKDVSFALIDGLMGFGNGRVIPSGPLRQSLADGYALTDAFILIGDDHRNIHQRLPATKPLFKAHLQVPASYTLPQDKPYVAFCGIGFPDKFKLSLEKAGARLVGWRTYGDHHPYTAQEIRNLIGEAQVNEARLITTEKDYARLPDIPEKSQIEVLPVEIVFDDPQALTSFIHARTALKRGFKPT